jgi:hypothetical protein
MFLTLLKASPISASFGPNKKKYLIFYSMWYVGTGRHPVSNKIKDFFCVFQELAGFFKNSTDQLVTDPNHKAVYFTAMNILGTFYVLVFFQDS